MKAISTYNHSFNKCDGRKTLIDNQLYEYLNKHECRSVKRRSRSDASEIEARRKVRHDKTKKNFKTGMSRRVDGLSSGTKKVLSVIRNHLFQPATQDNTGHRIKPGGVMICCVRKD
eukprot:scaffold264151_cov20-Prasinocladus_malaysianus.AAC.1